MESASRLWSSLPCDNDSHEENGEVQHGEEHEKDGGGCEPGKGPEVQEGEGPPLVQR